MGNSIKNINKCPDCGAEINKAYAEEWLLLMDDSVDNQRLVCPQCGASIEKTKDGNGNDVQENESNIVSVNKKPKFLFIAIFGLFIIFLLFLNTTFDVLSWRDDKGQILYILIWLFIISLLLSTGGKLKKQIKYATIWLGIFLVFIAGYSYRSEISQIKNRILSNILPEYGSTEKPGSMSFSIASDGHYYIRATVEKVPIRFLVDTGASHIVLSPKDAKKIGYDPDKISYDRYYETANGFVRGSSIRLRSFKIGTNDFMDVAASINEAPMSHSLLGMSFFYRLESYKVEKDVLTLYWKN